MTQIKSFTMEMTNRFNGLELIDGLPEELWMEVCNIVQEAGATGCLKCCYIGESPLNKELLKLKYQ